MPTQELLKKQIDEVFNEFLSLRMRSKYDDISDLTDREVVRFNTRARALVHRIAPPNSPYVKQCEEIIKQGGYHGYLAKQLAGVIDSLRADVTAGFLQTQTELIHGDLFADFLEMAQHLLDEGYKDAGAVIAGSSLEAHLRQLANKAGGELDSTQNGRFTPKKCDRLNADLANANVYSKLDLKNVIAWLDLRNKSAHGQYDEYDAGQVGIMIAGIRDFISRNPA